MNSSFRQKVNRSSFGTRSAVAARNSVTPAQVARVVARASQISGESRTASAPQNRPSDT